VEFAIIVPVGLALLAGIIQFGFALFIESHMAGVARDTARRFAVGASDQAEAAQFAQDSLINWGVTYTVTVTPPDPSDPSDVDVNVLISLPRSSVALIDMAGLFQSGTLTTTVTMLTE
jgi:Flp pilus assembly protein TadG